MNRLILGDGLLGSELVKQSGWDYISRKNNDIDFTNIKTYEHMLSDCDEVINCIAYTILIVLIEILIGRLIMKA